MIRFAATLPTLLLLLWAPGCIYDLDVEGKLCETTRPCPPGYHCAPADGGSICKQGSPKDGGDDDAGDLPPCYGTETECADIDTLLSCSAGSWEEVDCGNGKYCTDFGGSQKAACVTECTDSDDCGAAAGFYCNQDTHHCEPQGDCEPPVGVNRCNTTRTAVVVCKDESFLEEVVKTCLAGQQYCDPVLADCRNFCDSDAGCQAWPLESCNLSSRTCERIRQCTDSPWCSSVNAPSWIQNKCAAGICECTEGVCVIKPTEQATPAGTPTPPLDMNCYPYPANPPATPAACGLEGSVVSPFNSVAIGYNQYILVQVHDLADVLAGVEDNPIASTSVNNDAGASTYSFTGLPTNTQLVMDVHCECDPSPCGSACTLHPMYTFVIYLRSDDCQSQGGTMSFSAPAIDESLWQAYSTAGDKTTADPKMGLVFGRLRDCTPNALLKGTGDITMPYYQFGDHKAVFYIPFGGPPQLTDASTLSTGFFGAANALPVRGLASALIRDGAGLIWLRTYPIRVFPGAASLVLFDKPVIPR